MSIVFISHSAKDRSFIEKDLIPTLSQHGIETWNYKKDIHTADPFERKISGGLKECDWFLVVLTKNAVKSDWVTTEVHWALANRKGHVIPLLLRTCRPSDMDIRLGRLNYVDFRKDKNSGFKDLLKVWGKDFIPDETGNITQVTKKKKILVLEKKVWIRLVIFATLVAAFVLIYTNTNFSRRLIKASHSRSDSATIRIANYYYSKAEALTLQGNSQYNIGLALYNKGEFKQSFGFFKKSVAASNDARAECMLGVMYYSGKGTAQKDYKQAFEWLVKSSNQRNDFARLWLGVFYMKGYGTEKNIDTAKKYFNWVIENGGKARRHEARKNLATLN